jgi:hypothetical protein
MFRANTTWVARKLISLGPAEEGIRAEAIEWNRKCVEREGAQA